MPGVKFSYFYRKQIMIFYHSAPFFFILHVDACCDLFYLMVHCFNFIFLDLKSRSMGCLPANIQVTRKLVINCIGINTII